MFPRQIDKLIDHIGHLPGIGKRQATRLAFYLFSLSKKELSDFAKAVLELDEIKTCSRCFNFATENLCAFCKNNARDQKTICVIEDTLDILPIERTGQYKGLYHVLGGLISPADGLTPDKLRIKELVGRIKKEKTQEIILALNPTTEGDTTALYLERVLKETPLKITRLARGLATGSDLEYLDENTLSSAILGRK